MTLSFVDEEQLNARWGMKIRRGPGPRPNIRGYDRFDDSEPDKEVPCSMQKAYEDWLANCGVGTFSIMLVCRCPKCSLRHGSL